MENLKQRIKSLSEAAPPQDSRYRRMGEALSDLKEMRKQLNDAIKIATMEKKRKFLKLFTPLLKQVDRHIKALRKSILVGDLRMADKFDYKLFIARWKDIYEKNI